MTTTTHKATCLCCGTGALTITVDDAGEWRSSNCPNCKVPPLSMAPETHAELMRRHDIAQLEADLVAIDGDGDGADNMERASALRAAIAAQQRQENSDG